MGTGAVRGFSPCENGLAFTNSWPHQPNIVLDVPGLGKLPLGDASNGLCGGMVFLVRDVFDAGLPPLTAPRPSQGTPLFDYIVKRLFDSFELPIGVLRYYNWMNTSDDDVGLWGVVRRGEAWKTVREEWPKIRATIDGGHPAPIGLVTVHSLDPHQLGRNHQVLAYKYDLDDATDKLRLSVYDPNTRRDDADDVTLELDLSTPTEATAIKHNVNIGDPVRGVFAVDYEHRTPPAA